MGTDYNAVYFDCRQAINSFITPSGSAWVIANTGTVATEKTSRTSPAFQCRGRIPTALDSLTSVSDISCGLTASRADEVTLPSAMTVWSNTHCTSSSGA